MAALMTALLPLMTLVMTASSNMVTSLPGGGNIEVEAGSRGEVCMYVTDDWGTVESTQCTSRPGTYTMTGRGGGQARVTISETGEVSVNTGFFSSLESTQRPERRGGFGAALPDELSEEDETNVRFGSYNHDYNTFQGPGHIPDASPVNSPPLQRAGRPFFPHLASERSTLGTTLPPVHESHLPSPNRQQYVSAAVPAAPPVTEDDLGAVDILASGPGQLTVFGNGGRFGGLGTTPTSRHTPDPLVARKKRNRLSPAGNPHGAAAFSAQHGANSLAATHAADGSAVLSSRHGGDKFSAVHSSDGSSVITNHHGGNRLSSVQSNDGSSVFSSHHGGNRLSSVQSNDGSSVFSSHQGGNHVSSVYSTDGSSVLTSRHGDDAVSSVQSADGSSVVSSSQDGRRLGVVRSPDGSVVFSTVIDGRMVNVVRSSDGSSVISTNVGGRRVTALISPSGQRLIAGAGPETDLDAFFDQLMPRINSL